MRLVDVKKLKDIAEIEFNEIVLSTKSGVRPSFFGFVLLINLFRNAADRGVVTSNFEHKTLLDS